MHRYETHLHTYPVSRCAHAGVEESIAFYKERGYAGVFITNHFLDGNINVSRSLPYAEQIAYYFSDYEKAVEIGKKLGIAVFCGVELSYGGTDFLVYGLDKAWFLAHPEIMDMKKSEELPFLMENGALVIQAHPYREASYIDHIRLFPRHVHGVEIVNGNQSDVENQLAKTYCEYYGLTPFAGSDNHFSPRQKKLAGICFEEPICSEADFVEKIKSRKGEIFEEILG